MQVQLFTDELSRFNNLVAPYNTQIRVGNGLIKIGRGSWPTMFNIHLFGISAFSNLETVLEIGQFCEFNKSLKILVGGEHLKDSTIVNLFSGSEYLRKTIGQGLSPCPVNRGRIEIGSNVIGSADVVILSNSKIASNTVIAANSVVKAVFEPNEILGAPRQRLLAESKNLN